MSAPPHHPDWTSDGVCGRVRLAGQTVELRLRTRLAEEAFRSHTPAREFVPLSVREGRRTAIVGQFYTADPARMPAGLRRPRIGEAEAYYYHADTILLLWRCNLLARERASDPVGDDNLSALWNGFEAYLLRQFPRAGQMVTPAWNRPYVEARWQAFLAQRGFARRSPTGIPGAALIKDLHAGS